MCTKIQFKTKQDNVIVARTGEFEAYCETNVLFLPKGSLVNRWVNNEELGNFTIERAIVGTTTPFLSGETLLDGMNESGLVFNTNYYSRLTKYKEYSTDEINEEYIDFTVLPTLILSKCESIDEAIELINSLEGKIGVIKDSTNHPYWFSLTDRNGNTIVVQSEDERVTIKDNNKYGVLTNPPALEKHISNADQFLLENDSNVDEPNTMSNSSTKNLPGGFDAESRYIRAAYITKNMESVNDGDEAINAAFRILHTSDVVAGTALLDIRDNQEYVGAKNLTYSEREGHIFYHTDVIIVSDTKNLKYYWTTFNNITPRYVDINDLISMNKKVSISKYNDGVPKFTKVNI